MNVIGQAAHFNICFAPAHLSNHAGVVLLKEFADRLGVAALLDARLAVKQRERGYSEADSCLALVWNLILGGSCLHDLHVLRGDAGTCALLGLPQVLAPTTAGEFLRKFSLGDVTTLISTLNQLAERVRPWQLSEIVTMDFDNSLYPQCSPRKQGARKGYTGAVGYAPLFCFWAEEGALLRSHLLAGNRHPGGKAAWFLGEVLRVVPPGRQLKARADSAFYQWDFILALERAQVTYAITADQTPSLLKQVAALPERAWQRYGKGTEAEVAEFRFAPDRQAAHRYVVKREPRTTRRGVPYWHYHVIITNDERATSRQVMRWALKRCAMENQIKEHKHGFGLAKLPTNKYHANWAWLLLGQLAFNLVAWFKRCVLPETYHTATIKTLRHHLLNVAGKLVHSGRQWFLHLSEHSYFQDLWAFALKRLADMKSG